MALSRSAPKTRRADGQAGGPAADRKSALSVAAPMNSSAAMALGGLTKVSAKRQGGSAERSSTETVVPGAAPTTAVAARVNGGDGSSTLDMPKTAKPATRQGGSRSRG